MLVASTLRLTKGHGNISPVDLTQAEEALVVSVLHVPDGNSMYFHWVCPHAQIGFLTMCYFSYISFSFSLMLPLNCILVIMGTSNFIEKLRVQVFGRAVFIQVLL